MEVGRPRPVGTRGGCGERWGPGACPGADAIGRPGVAGKGQTAPPRTSTRPPHLLSSSPCPYRTRTPPPSFPHPVGKYHQGRGRLRRPGVRGLRARKLDAGDHKGPLPTSNPPPPLRNAKLPVKGTFCPWRKDMGYDWESTFSNCWAVFCRWRPMSSPWAMTRSAAARHS